MNLSIEMIRKAVNYCIKKHWNQRRKVGGSFYFWHPIRVASCVNDFLEYIGIKDSDVIVAALLHDVVEDTDTSFEEIEKEFGKRVATIVSYLTGEGKGLEKKRKIVNKLKNAPLEVKIIKMCDAYDNLLDFVYSLKKFGNRIWDKFNTDREGFIWYYNTILKILRNNEKIKGYFLLSEIEKLTKIFHL